MLFWICLYHQNIYFQIKKIAAAANGNPPKAGDCRIYHFRTVHSNEKEISAAANGDPPKAGAHPEVGRHRDDRPSASKRKHIIIIINIIVIIIIIITNIIPS